MVKIIIITIIILIWLVLTSVNFITILFWFTSSIFALNCKNLNNIILFSEIMWVVLYVYVVITGITNDDLILTSSSFLLLSLAGLEFCIGFIITIFFRNFKKSFDLDNVNNFSQKNIFKKLSVNKYFWSCTPNR